MIRKHGELTEVSWEEALKFTAEAMKSIVKQHGADKFAAFSSSSATVEEMFLLQKLMRSLGIENIDHRLQQSDFADQLQQTMMPHSSLPYEELEHQEELIIIGCNLVREVPLAGIRARKAVNHGAEASVINPVDYDLHFPVNEKAIINPSELPIALVKVLVALRKDDKPLPDSVNRLTLGVKPDQSAEAIAAKLQNEKAVIISGALIDNHPEASILRSLLRLIEQHSNAKRIHFTTGANSAGAWISGMLPHRTLAGRAVQSPGLNVGQALEAPLKGYFLHGVEPGYDFANPKRAREAMLASEFVVSTTAFADVDEMDYVDVILPIAPYAETSGTYINIDGTWQSFKGALQPYGSSRPAWKVFRVLGNLCGSEGFDYTSSEEVLDEVHSAFSMAVEGHYELYVPDTLPEEVHSFYRIGEWPIYGVDAICRHSEPLQKSAAADIACIRVHPDTAERLKLDEQATISQGDIEITLPLKRDERIALDAVYVPNGMNETVDLGHAFAPITIKR